MTGFDDHFSRAARLYASSRPTYPPALAAALADLVHARTLALDVGCGSGQLSRDLTPHFGRVVAVDASLEQLRAAPRAPGIDLVLARAEALPLGANAVDLVVAAQAAHWFDVDRFYAEVRRILRPEGVVALVTYGRIETDPAIAPAVNRFYDGTLRGLWPPERRHVEAGYASLPFPFVPLAVPALAIERAWNLGGFLDYVRTWSAVGALERAGRGDEFTAFAADVAAAWGAPERARAFRFPLALRAGRP